MVEIDSIFTLKVERMACTNGANETMCVGIVLLFNTMRISRLAVVFSRRCVSIRIAFIFQLISDVCCSFARIDFHFVVFCFFGRICCICFVLLQCRNIGGVNNMHYEYYLPHVWEKKKRILPSSISMWNDRLSRTQDKHFKQNGLNGLQRIHRTGIFSAEVNLGLK